MNPLKLAVITSAIVVAALSAPQDSSAMLAADSVADLAKVIFGINL